MVRLILGACSGVLIYLAGPRMTRVVVYVAHFRHRKEWCDELA
jgi:hypothetical protein